ncbi:hypothetical protein [Pelosinus sp. IPA-1]|uniref:hypothetical protein n=1 Tax=Pelosinus sp. IPA-1 TaxID=3029569 RepID=UPI0024362218|nr:hypothetical protein [Pelosinus sp. IPA-1]GMA99902.1 hypothetical protein PIPA1_27020 [Pelosinus sp. IPA-1]
MEYFRIKQDPECLEAVVIPDAIKQIDRRYVTPEEADRIEDVTVFRLDGTDYPEFIDILDRQLFLVSSQLKEVFGLYVPKLKYKIVIVANSEKGLVNTYHLPIFAPVDCLSEQSVMTPDKKNVRKLVLKQSLLGRKAIFKVQHDFENIIIARLDAAESMLRRNLRGIKMVRVELD